LSILFPVVDSVFKWTLLTSLRNILTHASATSFYIWLFTYKYCISTSVSGFDSDVPKIQHCWGCITHCIQHRLQEPVSESQTSKEGGRKARCYGKR